MDIAEWLRGLGLGQYSLVFVENGVDWQILPKLTGDDLKDIGVTAVGHRRVLLEAIAALRADGTDSGETQSGSRASSPVGETAPASAAERRQLSVMFCDLVGSTALSARFDPEDLREVIGAYQDCVANTIACFDGFVAKFMGDGVLIYFGYPQAHEDDAERAVRAGLALIHAVGRLDSPEQLQVRIGIATGVVVVGDLIGAGAAQERGVVGDTANLAARLETLARPGTLVVADATRRHIGGLFELEDLGPQPLAGFREPQHSWRVIAESGILSRFEALRSGATPLIGRDEELELLQRRWQQAKAGEGRVVLIYGEPGIGKSRLTAALYEAIEGEPHRRIRYFCSPHHEDSALYPIIVQLERAAGFARDEGPADKAVKLRAMLAPGAQDQQEIELISELLALPNTAAALHLSPQRKREMLFEALLCQLEALTRQQPVVMVFEDVHWIDPTSREALDLTLDRVRRLPVLLLITFRPEFQPPWAGQPHVTMLGLNRLGQRQVTELVLGLAGNTPLGSEVVEEIADRTDGVPLFVEELTKAVLERADQGKRVAAVLSASPLPALAVPTTLHASLIARLDRIGTTAKEVAQIGAVLGREFGYDLIERVAQRPDAELHAGLAHLTEAGLLFCRGRPPQSSYLFKHALVQDAAYGTLLRSRRQELHGRVAAALEQDFADLVERQPELLAHHLTGAGYTDRAADQWLKAGRHAAGRLTYLEAISHLERGLDVLRSLPESSARDHQEIELQLALGLCVFLTKGASEAIPAYSRAHELAESGGDRRQRFEGLYGVWQANLVSGGILAARQFSERLLRMTASEEDSGWRLQAHHSGWSTWAFAGEPARTRAHAEAGWQLYDPEEHASHRHLYGGHDPGVCARYAHAQAAWLLGFPETALASLADALTLAERIGHPFTLSVALIYGSTIHLQRREPEQALSYLAAVEGLAAEQRLSLIYQPGMLRGAVLLAQGATAEAVTYLRQSLVEWRKLGRTILLPYGYALLAEALTRLGERAAAYASVQEGFKVANVTGEHMWDAVLHQIHGLACLIENNPRESESRLVQSVQVAQGQQAKWFELRAATSLARLLGEQRRRAEANDLLAPLFGWFTEGFDTADLKEAKTLLDELR